MPFHQIRKRDPLPVGSTGVVQQRAQSVAVRPDRVDTLILDSCQVKPDFGVMDLGQFHECLLTEMKSVTSRAL